MATAAARPPLTEPRMRVVQGDITELSVQAIVNAANEQLAPGGGVCGAIHRAAGPELARACAKIGRCATGDAVITPGFGLHALWVIHAVGPVWKGGRAYEDDLLSVAYRRSLELASDHEIESLAFPAISTGIYGFPAERAAPIAVGTVARFLARHELPREVVFCCFSADSAALHREAIEDLETEQ